MLPSSGVAVPEEAPLDAELLGERLRRSDDPRLDLDLQLRPVEVANQLHRAIEPACRSVMMSVLVRSSTSIWLRVVSAVFVSSAARSRRLGVIQRLGDGHQLARERLLVGQLATRLGFGAQHVERRDADDRALDRVVELIGAQDDVERLIPRHLVQRDVDGALHVGIDDQIQAGDLSEGAEHRAQVDALEVEADRVPRELLRRRVARFAIGTVGSMRLAARRAAGGCAARAAPTPCAARRRSTARASVKLAGAGVDGAGSATVMTTLRGFASSVCTR